MQTNMVLTSNPIIPEHLPQVPSDKAMVLRSPCQHPRPTPGTTQRGCRQEPKPGIMVCTKDNDSESCYWLFSKRNSFLLEN